MRTLGRTALAIVAALMLVGAGAARADRLFLQGGGVIKTGNWWVEGTELYYDNGAGAVGLPRSMVLRIESDEAGDSQPVEPAAAAVNTEGVSSIAPQKTVRVTRKQKAQLDRGKQALEIGDYETAAEVYGLLLSDSKLEPELQTPRIGYAMAQLALDDDALALSAVLDGLARDPYEPSLLELLGDLRDREERVQEALQSWREAFDRAPGDRLRKKIEKAERELHAGRNYDLRRSAHFNLRHDGNVNRAVADELLVQLEELYWQLATELSYTPAQPITVMLYPEREFRDVTQAADWVAGLYDGKIRVPLGGLRRITPQARALLAHELTHAVVHSKSRGHCPRWLHEGLAQRFEGRSLSPAQQQQVQQRLSQSAPEKWETAGFSYPMALSLTSWLEQRRGLHALIDLLELLGDGHPLEDALVEAYGEPYAVLCRRWARSVLDEVGR